MARSGQTGPAKMGIMGSSSGLGGNKAVEADCFHSLFDYQPRANRRKADCQDGKMGGSA